MRNTLCAAALLSIALVGAGCKKSPSLVGKWTGTMKGQTGTFEFKPDDTFDFSMKQAMLDLTFTGTYKVEGENLSMTSKDVSLKGAPKGTEETIKKAVMGQMGKTDTSTFKFVTDDQVTIKAKAGGQDGDFTLNRVKEGA